MNPRIILPGILIRDLGGAILEASSSVVLLQTEDKGNILIDTGEYARRAELISALKTEAGLDPEDISFLVNTHSHPDHTGNNEIFDKAMWLIHPKEFGGLINNKTGVVSINEGYEISSQPRAHIIETPGHTWWSISIIVETDHVYAITGDALPIEDNYLQWVPPGINIDPGLALKSMERIVETADYVLPGHDKMFKIDK